MAAEEVVAELKALSIIGGQAISNATSEAAHLELEKNLWHLYRSIFSHSYSRELITGISEGT
jgi:hypothetical protein